MSDWPFLINFFLFVLLPCGIIFGLLFWALHSKDKR